MVTAHDPVRGKRAVSGNKAKVWVHASTLAIGIAVEVNGAIIEDASWLRPDDCHHINLAELDAVIRGLNVALSWQLRDIEVMTDSTTVCRWLDEGLSGKSRLKTKAASEMLIRRRIATVTALVEEYDLKLTVTLVESAENRADALTRILKRWLTPTDLPQMPNCAAAVVSDTDRLVTHIHCTSGHPGVKRTLYFVKRSDSTTSKRLVSRVVNNCDVCRSVDPAPTKWRHGNVHVERIWQRVSMDITHFRGRIYLMLIDCGPSRCAIWRPLMCHSSTAVSEQLESIFSERGALEELLTYNDTAFRARFLTT
uniref:RNase H type-1 domain-containing protein n=1 Tax=Trichuris muris TaxID=70415 RepID=A0A5S6QVK1_TRIMR